MAIFKWLNSDDNLIKTYKINDFRRSQKFQYLNLELIFRDFSVLYIKEFREPSRRKYSFHWQKKSGELIARWDNAPHFPNLPNFPHHKHLSDSSIEESYDIPLDDVLQYIADRIY